MSERGIYAAPLPLPARTKRIQRLWDAEDSFLDPKMRDRLRALLLCVLTESVDDHTWDAAIERAKTSLLQQQRAGEVMAKL